MVSRFEEHDSSFTDVDPPGFTEVPLVVAGNPARRGDGSIPAVTIDRPESHPEDGPSSATVAPPEWSDVTAAHSPVTQPEELGPAVPIEPWTPAASAMTPPASPGVGLAAQRAGPITAVQRQVVGATSAVQRADPLSQRQRAAETEPARPSLQPPLVVSRHTATDRGLEMGPRAGQGMPFDRMFSGAGPSPSETGSTTESVHPTVQREPTDSGPSGADPSMAAATQSEPPAVAAFPGGPGPAGGEAPAGSGPNLDEMARRLYEPLAARLREELWLDRERAGLMSDA